MKMNLIAILVLFVLAIAAESVHSQSLRSPTLTTSERSSDNTLFHRLYSDGQNYYYVDEVVVDKDLPIQPNTMMAVYTDRELTTKRLRETDIQTLTVSSLGEVNGRYSKYVEPGNAVTVTFKGRSAGFIKQAIIEIDISDVVVHFDKYTKIGVRNGLDVLIPPGVYRLTLFGELRNFQFSGMFNHNVPPEKGGRVKRGFFGSGSSSSLCEDRLNPLNPLNPLSSTTLPFFAVCGIAKLVKIGVRRPDWYLPSQTMLTFNIDRIKATRLQGIPPQAGSLRPVKQSKQ